MCFQTFFLVISDLFFDFNILLNLCVEDSKVNETYKKSRLILVLISPGTSFGLSAGSNSDPFLVTPTSYDYDAPIRFRLIAHSSKFTLLIHHSLHCSFIIVYIDHLALLIALCLNHTAGLTNTSLLIVHCLQFIAILNLYFTSQQSPRIAHCSHNTAYKTPNWLLVANLRLFFTKTSLLIAHCLQFIVLLNLYFIALLNLYFIAHKSPRIAHCSQNIAFLKLILHYS